MKDNKYYTAILVEGSAVPTLMCGHCHSILSRSRIFRNEGEERQDTDCKTIGLCSADDCGAANCCDQALSQIDDPELLFDIAS